MQNAKASAASSSTSPLAVATIIRRDPTAHDVLEVLFCGICHSDLHQVRDEWNEAMPTVQRCVPGHSLWTASAKSAHRFTKIKAGDLASLESE